ncbi:hypothetical protein HPULCUR_009963 [Helicostylum pulchrum]|uniref:Metallo-beta-lactamase domain-containing protein n=1 Tax=Helicostylum pulchrum TaxID=562976 RepID=A0ABP9YBZ1_9FUNG
MTLYETSTRDDLPALPNFLQLSERVWRVMGLNPGKFTLQGTNTYIIGTGQRKVLIDCGDGQKAYVPLLIESLKSIDPDAYISDILISHCHVDHWGGLVSIMSSELNTQQTQNIKVHKYPILEEFTLFKHMDAFPDTVDVTDLQDNQMFEIDEDTHIRVVHTPGHAKDHCAFLLEEEGTVFSADCILGHGSVAFEDLTEYIGGLNRIKELQPSKLYPGHGEVVNNGVEKVEQYLSIRMIKENQILNIMKRDVSKYWTPIELVDQMNSSSKGYNEQLMAVVVRTLGLHLIKLYVDGKVELVSYEKFTDVTGLDPYDANNVFSIVNQRWKCTDYYINSSKL